MRRLLSTKKKNMAGKIRPRAAMPIVVVVSTMALVLASPVCLAGVEWGRGGVPICVEEEHQMVPNIADIGGGEFMIAWIDDRGASFGEKGVYAQRVNGEGDSLWDGGGLVITDEDVCIYPAPEIAPDGQGGAIVVWEEYNESYDSRIYAQKVGPGGDRLWLNDSTGDYRGIPVSAPENYDQDLPRVIPDGQGGAIVTWEENRSGDMYVFAQKIDADGDLCWWSHGIPISSDGYRPQLAPDGYNGAILVWIDYRSGMADIYAQRVDRWGRCLWESSRDAGDGVPVCNSIGTQGDPGIISGGSGGAIVTWRDERAWSETRADIYAQKLDGEGTRLWLNESAGDDELNGIVVCGADREQDSPQMVSDDSGGAIVTWRDSRDDEISEKDIYAQRVDSSGDRAWVNRTDEGEDLDGIVLCDEDGWQIDPEIVSDGGNGAIVVWHDSRSGYPGRGIYGERVNGSGVTEWASGSRGMAICTVRGAHENHRITADDTGGAILVWQDDRDLGSTGWDIYGQKVTHDIKPWQLIYEIIQRGFIKNIRDIEGNRSQPLPSVDDLVSPPGNNASPIPNPIQIPDCRPFPTPRRVR